MENDNFVVFILTNGRPDKVITYDTLKKCGYTGKIYLIIDNEDKTVDKYIRRFGIENVIIFDKIKIAKTFDEFDNFNDRRAIIYARNACFDIAESLGEKYFLELDDDYTAFDFRVYIDKGIVKPVNDLDKIFDLVLDYYKTIPAKSIAFAQGGDFIGGIDNGKELFRFSKRKVMNTFFCSTDRRFNFIGRINEDVNTYTSVQSRGELFLTIQNLSITQKATQKNKGGMSELYLDSGTYIKSFYTVICSPSCVKIRLLNSSHKRMHHSIDWNRTVPCIINERHKLNSRY